MALGAALNACRRVSSAFLTLPVRSVKFFQCPFFLQGPKMNPFELFQAAGIYKLAVLYFSKSRGLAIVGRHAPGDGIEVIQFSGEVDPHTGNFIALDYQGADRESQFPIVSRQDFENLVSFIEAKIDDQTRMSVIEPDILRSLVDQGREESTSKFLH